MHSQWQESRFRVKLISPSIWSCDLSIATEFIVVSVSNFSCLVMRPGLRRCAIHSALTRLVGNMTMIVLLHTHVRMCVWLKAQRNSDSYSPVVTQVHRPPRSTYGKVCLYLHHVLLDCYVLPTHAGLLSRW